MGPAGILAGKSSGVIFMFFNTLKRKAGMLVESCTRTGKLRDGWKSTVVNHGASRATYC